MENQVSLRGQELLAILRKVATASVTSKDFVQYYGAAELKKLLKGGHVVVDDGFLEITSVGRAVLRRLSGAGAKGRIGRGPGLFARLKHQLRRFGRFGK